MLSGRWHENKLNYQCYVRAFFLFSTKDVSICSLKKHKETDMKPEDLMFTLCAWISSLLVYQKLDFLSRYFSVQKCQRYDSACVRSSIDFTIVKKNHFTTRYLSVRRSRKRKYKVSPQYKKKKATYPTMIYISRRAPAAVSPPHSSYNFQNIWNKFIFEVL